MPKDKVWKAPPKEDAMQRKQRLERLAEAGDKAKQQLGSKETEDVNKHKWKGSM
jgi:hypothetical protein